jgi:hypothetical protein
VLIRLPGGYSDAQGAQMLKPCATGGTSSVELRRIEFVGPQVGDELREQGGLAMLLALGLVMLYIGFRFQFKFAVGAVVALIHDVLHYPGFLLPDRPGVRPHGAGGAAGGDRLLPERHDRGLGPHPRELPQAAPRRARVG